MTPTIGVLVIAFPLIAGLIYALDVRPARAMLITVALYLFAGAAAAGVCLSL